MVLRLVSPEDKELLRRGFERWSAESRYARFPAQAAVDRRRARVPHRGRTGNHFALGAIRVAGDGRGEPVGLGIARFIRLAEQPGEPVTAEAAIAVADEAQGQGLGRLLFLRLVAAAAERGIERFRCEVLGSNASMKTLIDAIAPEHTTECRPA